MRLPRMLRALFGLPPSAEPLLMAIVILLGLLCGSGLFPTPTLNSYGPRGDGSDPLAPGRPVMTHEGQIVWIEQTPPTSRLSAVEAASTLHRPAVFESSESNASRSTDSMHCL
jgi:hypothetical protein